LKNKKLNDFKLISNLLINRLHQYRFAFAGTEKLSVKLEFFDLYEILKPITHLWHHEATKKGLTFLYDDIKTLPAIYSDKELLQCILFNIISNAIKYSYKNNDIKFSGEASKTGGYSIKIINRGIKIDPTERELIWKLSYRSYAARKTDARGMGVGLSVSRELARLINASISLLDETGDYTIFEIKSKGKGNV